MYCIPGTSFARLANLVCSIPHAPHECAQLLGLPVFLAHIAALFPVRHRAPSQSCRLQNAESTRKQRWWPRDAGSIMRRSGHRVFDAATS